MINVKQIPEFNKAIPIIEKIEEAGFEAYFVGGGVRDTLLHLPISDVDIASSATPDEIQRIFPITFDVGIKHGTVMVLYDKETYEITTFRTESKYEKFRRPEKVDYVRSLEEDLKRRDFTINAIALNRMGQIKDPFDGQKDIDVKLIRAVGNPIERFREDALRMMRAARFMSQLGFNIEPETKAAVVDYHPLLSKIAIERVREEWTKLLLGRNRKGGIKFFVETRLYHMCPGLQNKQDELIDLALFPLQFKTSLAAWTTLLYFLDVEKEEVDEFLRGWKLSNKEINQIRKAYHALKSRLNEFWDFHLLFETGIAIALEVEELITGFGLTNDVNRLLALDKTMPIHSIQDMSINGKEVMALLGSKRGGPYLGTILSDVKNRILSQRLENDKEIIKTFIEKRRFIYLDEVHTKSYTVTENDTAEKMGSGDLTVLSSPSLIAFMENCCKEMMAGLVENGQTTVGTFISMKHSAPSKIGATIIVEARIKELSGSKYSFSVVARDGEEIIAIGEHTRAVVDSEKFMKKITS
ncbi:CCA tRNA nucleotidyltransferase [Jeotgalibaca sp. A122]|uniref:CCA tRNA nucleotidyltransferase n=1 Tax=Jeotgalibaca sp. A122 TaxID=3457322 RepID=UPI003FD4D2E3